MNEYDKIYISGHRGMVSSSTLRKAQNNLITQTSSTLDLHNPQADEKVFVNIGTGEDVSIKELAMTLKKTVGFEGTLTFGTSKPDGTPRKLMDVSKINALGWKHSIGLEEGITSVYEDYKSSVSFPKQT